MTWVRLTKRTNDPKLAWIERQLQARDIPTRRNGESWHGPIMEVPAECEAAAWQFLRSKFDDDDNETVDDMEDDDPVFSED